MMGYQDPPQGKLFYTSINLEKRIRADHPLRRIDRFIDFDFIYKEVEDNYGLNGNVSVPPPVILKLLLLLVFYNVRSERELMETLPERLDWLWFLGYDLDTEIPGHSVLSKARKRWGVEAFKRFFERVVWQCVEAGLVDGNKIFVDSSLVDANASNNSVIDTLSLRSQLNEKYKQLESRLEERENTDALKNYKKVNNRYISRTDPDAAIVNRGKPKLSYQVHRAVDQRSEIITATETSAGDVNEAHVMFPLINDHKTNTEKRAETVVADSKYGTIENFLACHDSGIKAHIPDLREAAVKRTKKRDIFTEDHFMYDQQSDTYTCPSGNILKKKSLHANRGSIDYGAPKKVCAACGLREQCTKNKSGRTVKRHLRQAELDYMREISRSNASKTNIKTRQHLMERSFAQSKRYGYDRARWRGLWRVKIQEYLTCTIQNIQVLVKYGYNPKKTLAMAMGKPKEIIKPFLNPIKPFIQRGKQQINKFMLNIPLRFRKVGLCCQI